MRWVLLLMGLSGCGLSAFSLTTTEDEDAAGHVASYVHDVREGSGPSRMGSTLGVRER